MKNAVFAGLAVATVVATPVIAADMPIKARPPVVAAYSWTGCYVGSTVGGGWGDSKQTSAATGSGVAAYGGVVNNLTGAPATIAAPTNGLPAGTYPFAVSFVPVSVTNAAAIGTNITGGEIKTAGYMSGGEVGCQYHNGSFVIGVEGDGAWSSVKGDHPDQDGFKLENCYFVEYYRRAYRQRFGANDSCWIPGLESAEVACNCACAGWSYLLRKQGVALCDRWRRLGRD